VASSVLITALALASLLVLVLWRHRTDAIATERTVAERTVAVTRGSHKARLQYPSIDLSNCIGCGACVRACPEDGVLQLAYGQAVVVHGARCIGHGLCAEACPTTAIALTLGDLKDRRDLPSLDGEQQAVGTPGLFLAGEITGFALVRTAVTHGAQVARAVKARLGECVVDDAIPDLLVIGLGPAGLSCMLAAKELGMRAVGIDQATELGGTVAAYPRRKLVMTQPMDLPLHGRLKRLEYTKEQLVELWQGLAHTHGLKVRMGTSVERMDRRPDGTFVVLAGGRKLLAKNVCLAIGRRGTPRRLGVPGEDLPKVAYSLLDAESYRDRRILVVGGGDSAVEAALALAEQPGNEVALSYRKEFFSRLKAKNEQRIQQAFDDGLVQACMLTEIEEITETYVTMRSLANPDEHEPAATAAGAASDNRGDRTATAQRLENDHVFIFAGGTPPFPLLEAAGVSFDPADRPAEPVQTERGTGLLVAMCMTMVGLIALLVVRQVYSSYFNLAPAFRGASDLHEVLRPQGRMGLLVGLAAVVLFLTNLLYLVRRTLSIGRRLPGSLKAWMNMHVATGLAACLFAVLHSGFTVRDSAGGHALLAMIVVVIAGVVGRWFYAFVPRAQNGRQKDIDELGTQVAAIASEWDTSGRGLNADARQLVEASVDRARIGRTFVSRVVGLVRSQWQLRKNLAEFAVRAQQDGLPAEQTARIIGLARRSHQLALQLAYYDDLRGLLSTWRWLHRWLAVLLLTLTAVHILYAVRFGGVDLGVLFGEAGK
jgi:dihydropyrimidine dehydrogenase (NAD+) subunit PreT